MTSTGSTLDHRQRTAERRRGAMRRRLIESAMPVFAEKGIDAVVIDDVIRASDVSRGTFYKYFASTRELMVALSEELADELMAHIETVVVQVPDPAERVALGIRLFIETAQAFPLFGGFIRATGLEAAGPASLIYEYLPPHLTEGRISGRFLPVPLDVQVDLIAGAVLLCVLRHLTGTTDTSHTDNVVASILRGIGLAANEAEQIAARGLPAIDLPDDSLLVRAHQRLHRQDGA